MSESYTKPGSQVFLYAVSCARCGTELVYSSPISGITAKLDATSDGWRRHTKEGWVCVHCFGRGRIYPDPADRRNAG